MTLSLCACQHSSTSYALHSSSPLNSIARAMWIDVEWIDLPRSECSVCHTWSHQGTPDPWLMPDPTLDRAFYCGIETQVTSLCLTWDWTLTQVNMDLSVQISVGYQTSPNLHSVLGAPLASPFEVDRVHFISQRQKMDSKFWQHLVGPSRESNSALFGRVSPSNNAWKRTPVTAV